LLENGADREIKNKAGKKPIDIAEQNKNPEIVQMLKDYSE
jgi:ankyrin repeat protein